MKKVLTSPELNKRIRLIMELRTKGITDTAVLSAMERVPRDQFVPEQVRHQAWEDTALPIGRGQTISQPYIVALMTQALKLSGRETVLEIGTGCGFQAAVLAHVCRRVYTVERYKQLLAEAEKRFNTLKLRNITALAADGMKGWPTIRGTNPAPFDRIVITAAAREKPPQALLDQLKNGGVLVAPVGENGEQILKSYKKESDHTYAVKNTCHVRFVPLLPDLEVG